MYSLLNKKYTICTTMISIFKVSKYKSVTTGLCTTLYEFNFSFPVSSLPLQQQTFGLGFAPKRILKVMEGEIARGFQLSKNTITPLPYVIPRKVSNIYA